jgi:hypothetical protein
LYERSDKKRPHASHIWARESVDWYVEPMWVTTRLFDVEPFTGTIHDPAVGLGRIVEAARAHGYQATGADIVDRGASFALVDFLETTDLLDNIIGNPPCALVREFAAHALVLVRHKVALQFPVARLNAAGKWLAPLPLRRLWLLTPRPSMPPGDVILRGEKSKGGKTDFAWLVFDKAFAGVPTINWLARGGVP